MAFWRSTSEKQRGFSLFPRYTSRDILRPAGHLVGAPQVHVPSSTGDLWYCPPRAMSPPSGGCPFLNGSAWVGAQRGCRACRSGGCAAPTAWRGRCSSQHFAASTGGAPCCKGGQNRTGRANLFAHVVQRGLLPGPWGGCSIIARACAGVLFEFLCESIMYSRPSFVPALLGALFPALFLYDFLFGGGPIDQVIIWQLNRGSLLLARLRSLL